MALVTPETKLCDVIIDDPSVIPVVNRFGIALGVGDSTVKSICGKNGIDTDFFLTVLNAFISESFFPENNLSRFGTEKIIEYLKKNDNSYLRYHLPNIERHFNALIGRSDSNNNLPLLLNLYKEAETEIRRRAEDDDRWFEAIAEGRGNADGINADNAAASSIEDKLGDLKSMFVIHLRGEYDMNLCHAVLAAITSLEKDIRQNNRIRNRILYPIAAALEEGHK